MNLLLKANDDDTLMIFESYLYLYILYIIHNLLCIYIVNSRWLGQGHVTKLKDYYF